MFNEANSNKGESKMPKFPVCSEINVIARDGIPIFFLPTSYFALRARMLEGICSNPGLTL